MNKDNETTYDGGFSKNPHTKHARVNLNGRTLVLSKGTTVQDLREKPMDEIVETDAGRA